MTDCLEHDGNLLEESETKAAWNSAEGRVKEGRLRRGKRAGQMREGKEENASARYGKGGLAVEGEEGAAGTGGGGGQRGRAGGRRGGGGGSP